MALMRSMVKALLTRPDMKRGPQGISSKNPREFISDLLSGRFNFYFCIQVLENRVGFSALQSAWKKSGARISFCELCLR